MRFSPARRLVIAALGALLLLPAAVAAKVFRDEYRSFDWPGRPLTDEQRERVRHILPNVSEVAWTSDGATLRGWFAPGSGRAAIVLVHGSGGNRADVLPELEILTKAGFSLLAFDWPGQGESSGHTRWDEPERAALRSAVDWLAARPEVDPKRIGAFGFSLGGYTLLQVAASEPQIRAVAVAGTPANMVDFTGWEQRRFGALAQWSALLAMQARGMHWNQQIPEKVVGLLAPRPLLVVCGGADTTVPPAMTTSLYDLAREPKELVALPKANHGEYAALGLGVYPEHLTSFFTGALNSGPGAAP